MVTDLITLIIDKDFTSTEIILGAVMFRALIILNISLFPALTEILMDMVVMAQDIITITTTAMATLLIK